MPSFEWLLYGFLTITGCVFIRWFKGSDIEVAAHIMAIICGVFIGPVVMLVLVYDFVNDRTNIRQFKIKGRRKK